MNKVPKTILLILALAAVGGCASYGDRSRASQATPTAGASTDSQSASAPIDRFFADEDRAGRLGR